RAHWIDVGGSSTGFGAGASVVDPWSEGLQLDQLKIYEKGKLDETLYRVLKDNIRFPESSLGDMKSQMAACRLAARRMDELFDKYGRDTILAAIDRIFEETERKCRNVVAALADGVYEASAAMDDDGVLKVELEHHRADGRRHHRQGARAGDARSCAGRPPWPPRRLGRILWRAPEDQAPLRRTEHRRRRLGRTADRGRRARHRLGLPGRRAQ